MVLDQPQIDTLWSSTKTFVGSIKIQCENDELDMIRRGSEMMLKKMLNDLVESYLPQIETYLEESIHVGLLTLEQQNVESTNRKIKGSQCPSIFATLVPNTHWVMFLLRRWPTGSSCQTSQEVLA